MTLVSTSAVKFYRVERQHNKREKIVHLSSAIKVQNPTFFSFFQTQKCSMFRTLTHSHLLTLIENKTLIKCICTQQGSSALNERLSRDINWIACTENPHMYIGSDFIFAVCINKLCFFYTFQHKYWRHIFVKVQYIVNVYANVSYM